MDIFVLLLTEIFAVFSLLNKDNRLAGLPAYLNFWAMWLIFTQPLTQTSRF